MPFVLLAGSLGTVFAQQTPSGTSTSAVAEAKPLGSDQIIANAYIPLTLEQKYMFTIARVAGPGPIIALGFHALIDDAMNRPRQWGTDEGSIGLRTASAFGRSFLRQNIAFGVRALDHEDPRYFRSGHGRTASRVRYAAVHTLTARNDNGSTMPAYSLFVSASTMPFIAQSWRPEPFGIGRGFRGAGIGIGVALAADLWHEFWPDVQAKLPAKLSGRRSSWLTRELLDH